jgi:hypothetical protein
MHEYMAQEQVFCGNLMLDDAVWNGTCIEMQSFNIKSSLREQGHSWWACMRSAAHRGARRGGGFVTSARMSRVDRTPFASSPSPPSTPRAASMRRVSPTSTQSLMPCCFMHDLKMLPTEDCEGVRADDSWHAGA